MFSGIKKNVERYAKDLRDNLNSHCCYELCTLVAKYSNIKCSSEKELDTIDKRRAWLVRKDKRIIFHYTPYHGSRLNQVEYWFGMLNAKCLLETYHSPEAMQNAINEFVVLWNNILSKPFQWKYTGEGLHEKVAKRFIQMLNSTISIDRILLIKQLKLHINLIDEKVWLSLNEKSNSKSFDICLRICFNIKLWFVFFFLALFNNEVAFCAPHNGVV